VAAATGEQRWSAHGSRSGGAAAAVHGSRRGGAAAVDAREQIRQSGCGGAQEEAWGSGCGRRAGADSGERLRRRTGAGAEGGVCGGNAFAFLRIEGKSTDQKKRSPVVFRILGETTVEKIKLRFEAFGGILAFFHRESDFNRNQTGP
jgi:hypothetical protein